MSLVFKRRLARLMYIFVLLAILLVSLILSGRARYLTSTLSQNNPGAYTVSRFIDGDTVSVSMNGHIETIRFIGIDTPETHKPNTPVQCYGPEAAAYTKQIIGHQKIVLVSDPLTTDRDRYDRLLRYVYLTDGTNINQKLVREGYAFYYPYFPFTKAVDFSMEEESAISQHKGLWQHCKPTPTDSGGYISNSLSS